MSTENYPYSVQHSLMTFQTSGMLRKEIKDLQSTIETLLKEKEQAYFDGYVDGFTYGSGQHGSVAS